MASVYPGALDSFDAIPATLDGSPGHEAIHQQMIDAMEAVQAEIGTDPNGTATTLTPTSPYGNYAGGLRVIRWGPIVAINGYLQAGAGGVTSGDELATIPTGYRPGTNLMLTAHVVTGATAANAFGFRVLVNTDGSIDANATIATADMRFLINGVWF